MTDVEIKIDRRFLEIGHWLDRKFPNPPLPEPQRWSIGFAEEHNGDRRWGITFANEHDATIYRLRWGDGNG